VSPLAHVVTASMYARTMMKKMRSATIMMSILERSQ
jgi:hypothetical protein